MKPKYFIFCFYFTLASTSWILSMIFPCMSLCCWDSCLMAAVALLSSVDRRAIDVSHLTIRPRRSVRDATWCTSRFFTALLVPMETLSRVRILSSNCCRRIERLNRCEVQQNRAENLLLDKLVYLLIYHCWVDWPPQLLYEYALVTCFWHVFPPAKYHE